MKNYDQLLYEVAQEKTDGLDIRELHSLVPPIYIKIAREAAERYRAQLELPSNEAVLERLDIDDYDLCCILIDYRVQRITIDEAKQQILNAIRIGG